MIEPARRMRRRLTAVATATRVGRLMDRRTKGVRIVSRSGAGLRSRSRWIAVAAGCVAILAVEVAPASAADVLARSAFNTSAQGWTAVGDTASPVTFMATGGNPGGYVTVDDSATGGVMYWQAPAAFLGDKSAAYKGILRFDLRQSVNSDQFDTDDVILSGGGLTLTYNTATNPSLDPSWTRYTARLVKTGWYDQGAAAPATAADMQTALASISSLRIRAEYQTGPDNDDLDNPLIRAPAPPAR